MSRKRLITSIIIILASIGILISYLFWAYQKADFYAQVSRETSDKQEKILALEKSTQLWPKTENIISLADLYISIGRNDLAEGIMVGRPALMSWSASVLPWRDGRGRGDPQILNKLGSLYLSENKVTEAEKAFTKAKNKKATPDSLKGLILVELKKGDRPASAKPWRDGGGVENYLRELEELDSNSADCYAAFAYLNDFEKANNAFIKAKDCDLYGVNKYFAVYRSSQNPLYLRLEAANLYYSVNFLNLAEKDILATIKEKNNYRDAHVLASKIYEKLGDQAKASEHKQKALEIDPLVTSN